MINENLAVICSIEIPVRWGDMDAYAHVNNTLYLRYMEEARVQLLDQMGFTLGDAQQGPVVVNLQSSFLQPVVYPDSIRVDCFAGEPGNSSFMTYYRLFSNQQQALVCEGSAKIVWIDKQSNRSTPLPDAIRRMLEQQSLTQLC
jgi:acyl-CoA thioester hydrolase